MGIPNFTGGMWIGRRRGVNPGGEFRFDGVHYYLKRTNWMHMKSELLALDLYRECGLSVVPHFIVTIAGKPWLASKWVDGLRHVKESPTAAFPFFGASCWLANGDVVNRTANLSVDASGNGVLVDAGASLWFGACGGLKGRRGWDDRVPELQSFRGDEKRPDRREIWEGMTPGDFRDSLRRVANVDMNAVHRRVVRWDFPDDLFHGLAARRETIRRRIQP